MLSNTSRQLMFPLLRSTLPRVGSALIPQLSSLSSSLLPLSSPSSSRSFSSFSTFSSPSPSPSSFFGSKRLSLNIRSFSTAETAKAPENETLTTVADPENITGNFVKHEFQAETRKLLDIVARSLYTDKEVFVRELISNASDALEKFRHKTLTGTEVSDPALQPEINIYVDEKNNILTIQDFGIGMSKEELVNNLGTIARSGSLEYLKQLGDGAKGTNIIGQFGVGFYSTFMVANRVKVFSRSADSSSKGHCWVSDGSGTFEIAEADGVQRGTKIVMYLKDDCKEFSRKQHIIDIVKKYSNFVGFDIKIEGEQCNTIKALWMMPKDKISEQEHTDFYQFIAHTFDTPYYHLHYQTDSPVTISALFYIPKEHTEKYGMGRMESGVKLFSRKVMIQNNVSEILPGWLRFIKGVVDSPDIPLNLSREHLQDSALIKKINSVLTRRVLKFLAEQAEQDKEKYQVFWKEFGNFLREGIATDFKYKEELGKLLRCESSHTEPGKFTSLDEYISRMKPDQKDIYWLCIPTRQFAESSPYYEDFKKKDIEVLFFYTNMDDFVMTNLAEYKGKKLSTIESFEPENQTDPSSETEIRDLSTWLKDTLSERVSKVKITNRLVNSPAIVVDHESASFRRMMKFVDPQRSPKLPKQILEINPEHPIMKELNVSRVTDPSFAKEIAEQILDNALIAAGLLDDARGILPRLNLILEKALKGKQQ